MSKRAIKCRNKPQIRLLPCFSNFVLAWPGYISEKPVKIHSRNMTLLFDSSWDFYGKMITKNFASKNNLALFGIGLNAEQTRSQLTTTRT